MLFRKLFRINWFVRRSLFEKKNIDQKIENTMIYLKNNYLFIIVINFILFKSIIGAIDSKLIKYKDTDELVFHKDKNVNGKLFFVELCIKFYVNFSKTKNTVNSIEFR